MFVSIVTKISQRIMRVGEGKQRTVQSLGFHAKRDGVLCALIQRIDRE